MLQLFDGAHHYLLRNLWRSPAEWLQQNKKRLPNQICLSTLICWGYCRFYSAFYICKQVYTVWCSRIALSLFFMCASSLYEDIQLDFCVHYYYFSFFFCSRFPSFLALSRRYSLRFLMWFTIKICSLHFPSIERSSRPQIALSDTFVIRRMNIARRWARAIDNTMDS